MAILRSLAMYVAYGLLHMHNDKTLRINVPKRCEAISADERLQPIMISRLFQSELRASFCESIKFRLCHTASYLFTLSL